jgi:anthranilate synthase component I
VKKRVPGQPLRAVPHVREFLADSVTPLSVYRRLAESSPIRFLLESVTGGDQVSRFSFLGAAPREVLRLWPDRLEREGDGKVETLPGAPLGALREQLGRIVADRGPIPFSGGWVGFFGYDLVRLLERLPRRPPDPLGLPLAILGRFDTVVAFDHARQRVVLIANEIEGEVTAAAAERALDVLGRRLAKGVSVSAQPLPELPAERPPMPEASLDGASFRAAVVRAKDAIAAGDIFQVVLARRWAMPVRTSAFQLYRAVRMVNPSPYMVLWEAPDCALVGASPEMLVRKIGMAIETRPIAGTRPRGVDAEGDRTLAADLLADEKERAEHVMLVDLGRNDLGRVARPGSVRVQEFMAVERYSHVMHLVSSVVADLAVSEPPLVALDALLACFPAGTVSGAPKIRAMEIVDELEPEARGPYAGAVGYVSFSGDLDTCITIRTLVLRDGVASVTAGAGIVADSDPATEERETENKAAALWQAVALAEALRRDEEGRG